MEDLTIIKVNDLKKDIYNLVNEIYENDCQFEGDVQYHIFHAMKITKYSNETFTIKDVSGDKPVTISNKYLLYLVKQDLEYIKSSLVKEETYIEEMEAASEIIDEEPNQAQIEDMHNILKEARMLENEVSD